MTDIDIVNLALTKLGEEPISNIAGSSKAETLGARWYPVVRDEVMRMFPWSSLIARQELIGEGELWVLGDGYEIGDIVVSYDIGTLEPVNFYECIAAGISATLMPTGIVPAIDGSLVWRYIGTVENLTDYAYKLAIPYDCARIIDLSEEENYKREGRFIYTDAEGAILIYVRFELDPTNWTPLMQEAVVSGLAAKLAFPLTGSKELMQISSSEYATYLSLEKFASGNDSEQPGRGSNTWA